MEQNVLEQILEGSMEPTHLSLEILREITDGFSPDRIIGEGGFGTVYKILRRWRHRWNKSAKKIPPEYHQQVTKCIEIGSLCQKDDPRAWPSILEVTKMFLEIGSTNNHNGNANELTDGEINLPSHWEDDMLGVEPLELQFGYNKQKQEIQRFGKAEHDVVEAGASRGTETSVVEPADVEAGELYPCVEPVLISRVRTQLRRVDEDAFTPHSMVIGLYNHDKGLSKWTEMKEQAARHILSLDQTGVLKRELRKLEEKARRCYPQAPGRSLSSIQFSNMLLRDGCYLLLLFMTYTMAQYTTAQDHMTAACGAPDSAVLRDTVFLLENQIPLFVLQKIHEHVTGDTCKSTVLKCISVSVQEVLQAQLYISQKLRPAPPQASHLLHLVHSYLQPTSLPPETEEGMAWRTGRWRRATEYRCHANLRFKGKDFVNGIESSILDVSYQGGTLWIPRLRVDSNTLTILRNLMALEEEIVQRPVTAYCVFLSQVAGTVEDVKLLVDAGIVQQFASEKQLAQDFANLLTGVVLDANNPDQNYLKPIWHDLDEQIRGKV